MTDSNVVIPALDQRLLKDLLKSVSRAFYLTLWVLPRGLRGPIGLAYLLARAADTIADTHAVPREERVRYLLSLRQQVQDSVDHSALADLARALSGEQSSESERRLLESLPKAFELLEAMPVADAQSVRSIVVTLARGMEFDLTTFPGEGSGTLTALERDADLDSYTYMVAGCVGEFWTEIAIAHIGPLSRWDREEMSALGVRFGKALQMTNVLRDVSGDLRIGRCYLPKSSLDTVRVLPEDLLSSDNADRIRPVLIDQIRLTLEHYRSAESYLHSIPRRCVRLRLATAWPLLIGLGTLELLANNPRWLNPHHPSKVSRGWVYRMLALSAVGALSNSLMRVWIKRLRSRVERAL